MSVAMASHSLPISVMVLLRSLRSTCLTVPSSPADVKIAAQARIPSGHWPCLARKACTPILGQCWLSKMLRQATVIVDCYAPQEDMLGIPGSMTAMLLTLPLWFLKGSTAFFVRFTRRTCRGIPPSVHTADDMGCAQGWVFALQAGDVSARARLRAHARHPGLRRGWDPRGSLVKAHNHRETL